MNYSCNNDKPITNEEVYKSLLNDMDKVIRGLTNRLRDFITYDEINEVNSQILYLLQK